MPITATLNGIKWEPSQDRNAPFADTPDMTYLSLKFPLSRMTAVKTEAEREALALEIMQAIDQSVIQYREYLSSKFGAYAPYWDEYPFIPNPEKKDQQ